jgi:hypothetical protein
MIPRKAIDTTLYILGLGMMLWVLLPMTILPFGVIVAIWLGGVVVAFSAVYNYPAKQWEGTQVVMFFIILAVVVASIAVTVFRSPQEIWILRIFFGLCMGGLIAGLLYVANYCRTPELPPRFWEN